MFRDTQRYPTSTELWLVACCLHVQARYRLEIYLDYAWWEKGYRSGTAPTAPASEDWKEVAPSVRVTQKLQDKNQQPAWASQQTMPIDLPGDFAVA